MNLLTAAPPLSVEVGGAEYPINPDFRNILAINKILTEKDVEGVPEALSRFYVEGVPGDIEGAIEAFISFFAGGDKSEGGNGSKAEVIDFEHDADYIFAAFYYEYKINLAEVSAMHWWIFRSLFAGLKHSKINDIINIRATEISKDMSASEKKYYLKMKRLFALPKKEKKLSQLEQALLSGGSLEGLV